MNILLTFILLAHWLSLTAAQNLPPGMRVGSDGPADETTKGFYIYHAGLNVRNLTASMEFYGKVLGMREIFTIQYTPSYSLTYMGFSQGGRNGTGFQTGKELLDEKNNSGGMVKLLYFNESHNQLIPSTERTNTFANLGLVVPDIQTAQDRMDKYGVEIVKRIGETTAAFDSPIAKAFNIGPESTNNITQVNDLIKGLITTDFEHIIFLKDPDGNMLEVVEQNGF